MVFIILHSSNPCSYKVYDVGTSVAMFDSFDSRKQMSVVLNNCNYDKSKFNYASNT